MLCTTCRASDLFPSFMEFVKSKRGPEEEEKKAALLSQFREINDFLEEKGTPYIGGNDVCATDLKLGPQLKHIVVGGKQIKVRVSFAPSAFVDWNGWAIRFAHR